MINLYSDARSFDLILSHRVSGHVTSHRIDVVTMTLLSQVPLNVGYKYLILSVQYCSNINNTQATSEFCNLHIISIYYRTTCS